MAGDLRTAGESALVTGASSGIGYELTKLFAQDGLDVVLVSRSEEALDALADGLEAEHGIDATVIPTDLSVPGSAEEVYRAVEDGTVGTLVNNAGFGVYGEFTETDLETELDMIQLNLTTVTHLTKLFARDMAERGRGRILNVSSVAGVFPTPTAAVYSATKHYLLAFSEALAEELDDERITVTALCPGETDTGFMERGDVDQSAVTEADLLDPATVARAGYNGLADGDRIVVPGLRDKLRFHLRRALPRATATRAARGAWEA